MNAYKVTGTRHGYSVARYTWGLMEALETWNAWTQEGREDVRLERVAGAPGAPGELKASVSRETWAQKRQICHTTPRTTRHMAPHGPKSKHYITQNSKIIYYPTRTII